MTVLPPARDRGAAVISALIIVAIVAALTTSLFQRQTASTRRVENELARVQARVMLAGGIDWARLVIRESATCRDWMRRHGVNFQPPLSGALHVARTNAFFMGGGKALVNAYYRSAEALGVQIRYNAPVDALELEDGRFKAARIGDERIEARACVLAAGGFESNREWLREAWGQNERGEWPADNFLIRASAIRPNRIAWRSMRVHRCTTAASVPASIAGRWAW
ncbi:hypothetical protein G6F50_014286 [Rhizopus delemar]|uniref:FAD dependent oxidoreductase domain-containing protein n=1 Tax=Rhizopus delemar TaxID=936053 RepID=A0A9P6Y729_9FUNG|nr:hypothetical protein G6F50_014286 [Rhizopus delemar]